MNTNLKEQMVTRSRRAGAEQRLNELGIKLRRRLSRSAPMWKRSGVTTQRSGTLKTGS